MTGQSNSTTISVRKTDREVEMDEFSEFTEAHSPNDPDHILNCNGNGRKYIHPPFRTGKPTIVDNVEVHTIWKKKENGNAYGGQIFHSKQTIRLYILGATIREQREARVLKDGKATKESKAIGGHTMKRYRKEGREFRESNGRINKSFQGYPLKTNHPLLTYERAGKSEECFELTGKKGNTLRHDIEFHTSHYIDGRLTTDHVRFDYYMELAALKYDVDQNFITASGKYARRFWDELRAYKIQLDRAAIVDLDRCIEIEIPSIVPVDGPIITEITSDSESEAETVVDICTTVSLIVNDGDRQDCSFDEQFSDDVINRSAQKETEAAVIITLHEPKSNLNEPAVLTIKTTTDEDEKSLLKLSEQLRDDLVIECFSKSEKIKELNDEVSSIRESRTLWMNRSFDMKRKMKNLKVSNSAAACYLEDLMCKSGIVKTKVDIAVEEVGDKRTIRVDRVNKTLIECSKDKPCFPDGSEVCQSCSVRWSTSVAINILNYGIVTQNLMADKIEKQDCVATDCKGRIDEVIFTVSQQKCSKKRSLESNSRENVALRRRISVTDDEEFFSCDDEIPAVEIRRNGVPRSGKVRFSHASMEGGSLLNTPTTTDSEAEAELDLAMAQSMAAYKKGMKELEEKGDTPDANDDSDVNHKLINYL